jgi:hypothetical protein
VIQNGERIEPFGEGSGDRSNGRMFAPVVGAPWEKLRYLTCPPMDSPTIEIENDDEERWGVFPHSSAAAASFRTVFQLRAVPRVPSFFSTKALVRRDRPIPAG